MSGETERRGVLEDAVGRLRGFQRGNPVVAVAFPEDGGVVFDSVAGSEVVVWWW